MRKLVVLFALAAAYPLVAVTYSSGPPAASTGAPGEGRCDFCHSGAGLNAGAGTLEVSAVPAQYAGGEPVEITVRLEQDGSVRRGFQLSVRDANDQHLGTLALADPSVTQFADGDPRYVTHLFAGTSRQEWRVRWTPPLGYRGAVRIYAAGNAANGNNEPTGDDIYTRVLVLAPATGVAVEDGEAAGAFRLHASFPNPFVSATEIRFELRERSPVTLTVYDALGRPVRTLRDGVEAAGEHRVRFDAGTLPGGVYVCELRTPAGRSTRKVLLLR